MELPHPLTGGISMSCSCVWLLFPVGFPALFSWSEQIYPCLNLWPRTTSSQSPLFTEPFSSNHLHFCVYLTAKTQIICRCYNSPRVFQVPESISVLCGFAVVSCHGLIHTPSSASSRSWRGAATVSFWGPHCSENCCPVVGTSCFISSLRC